MIPSQRRLAQLLGLLVVVLLFALCSGCTVFEPIAPVGMFPREQSTRTAETVWQGLHAIDTAQTVQIARHPQCYREANPLAAKVYGTEHPSPSRVMLTNVALGLVHARVSRWFDDGVERAQLRADDSVGPWAVGRIAWHAVSILGTSGAVANNFSQGLTPTSARCPR
jgi:hypothetical protein